MIVSLFKKGAERGVSLRRFSWLMLFFSLVIMAILLYTTISTVRAFDALSNATGDYIELAAAADDLMDASDYLTEEVQRYTVIGDRTHLRIISGRRRWTAGGSMPWRSCSRMPRTPRRLPSCSPP